MENASPGAAGSTSGDAKPRVRCTAARRRPGRTSGTAPAASTVILAEARSMSMAMVGFRVSAVASGHGRGAKHLRREFSFLDLASDDDKSLQRGQCEAPHHAI